MQLDLGTLDYVVELLELQGFPRASIAVDREATQLRKQPKAPVVPIKPVPPREM